MIAVGVTDAVNIDELQLIATSPADVFLVPDFNMLADEIDSLVTSACTITPGVLTETFKIKKIVFSVANPCNTS